MASRYDALSEGEKRDKERVGFDWWMVYIHHYGFFGIHFIEGDIYNDTQSLLIHKQLGWLLSMCQLTACQTHSLHQEI